MLPKSSPSPTVRAYVQFLLRYGGYIWALAVLIAVPAAFRTADLYMHLRSELEELLPREAPSVKALDTMRARMPGLQFLGVVVEAKDDAGLVAGEQFLDDLAAKLRAYPPTLVRDVRTGRSEEKAFFEKHAAVYTEPADLKEILRRIEARRDYEIEKESGSLLDDEAPPPSMDISDIEKKYRSEVQEGDGGERFSSKSMHVSMLFVEAGGFETGANASRELLEKVRGDVLQLSPSKYNPSLRVGYASDVAINVEELDALQADLALSTVIVAIAEIIVIILYYGFWRSAPILIAPLLLATAYAFALSSLPPLNIHELNSNTAFLGSIILGNGINVGLILLARYREARYRGESVEEALVTGVWGARAGTIAAAVAASASYASLAVTEFRGFRQFGAIGAIGMITAWVSAFVLMPPLIRFFDNGAPVSEGEKRGHGSVMNWALRFVSRGAPAIVLVATLLAIGSGVLLSRFDSSTQLEYDFNKLRRADTWESGEGYWGRKMDAVLGHYLTPTLILMDRVEDAERVTAQLKQSAKDGPLAPYVARVVTVGDVLPKDQDEKLLIAGRIRETLTPKIRSFIDEDKRKLIDRVTSGEGLGKVTAAELPRTITRGLREKDGTLGRSLLVYPRPAAGLWKAEGIHGFVKALRDVASAGGANNHVAGSIPLSGDILKSIARDAPIASLVSFLGVVLVVVVVVRGWRPSLWVLSSLLLGVLWLVGITMSCGIKINFANFIAFPITFGIGVDYAVNVIARYVQDGEEDVAGAIRSTGGAVVLCSITTIIGYSSLLLAKNRALFLFGLLAVLGEIACLTAAVIVLPAALLLMQRLRAKK